MPARGGKGDLGSHLPPAAGTKLHRGQPLTAGQPALKNPAKGLSVMQHKTDSFQQKRLGRFFNCKI